MFRTETFRLRIVIFSRLLILLLVVVSPTVLADPPQGDGSGRNDWLARVAGHYARHFRYSDYEALVRDSAHARTAYYLFDGRLWGFGLFQRGSSPCR